MRDPTLRFAVIWSVTTLVTTTTVVVHQIWNHRHDLLHDVRLRVHERHESERALADSIGVRVHARWMVSSSVLG